MARRYCTVTIHKGQRFNRLVAVKYEYTKIYQKANYHYFWRFKCDCENEIIVDKNSVLKKLTQSCGCLHSEISSNIYNEINKDKSDKDSAFNRLFNSYKHGGEKRGYGFLLTKEEFKLIVSKNCYYCNRIPSQMSFSKNRKNTFLYNGIDRVNNNEGYLINNTVPCCKHCNRAKMSLSKEQFLQLVKDIYNNLIKDGI